MIDPEMRRLVRLEADRPLSTLEIDIWRRAAWLSSRLRITRAIAASQGVLLVCAVVASAVAGYRVTAGTVDRDWNQLTISKEKAAPSALLFNDRP